MAFRKKWKDYFDRRKWQAPSMFDSVGEKGSFMYSSHYIGDVGINGRFHLQWNVGKEILHMEMALDVRVPFN